MSALVATTVYTTDPPDATANRLDPAQLKQDIKDWAKGIKEAESDEVQRALLVKKQEAERALHPPEPAKEAVPDHIADSGLRAMYERSEAQEADREPVKKATRNGSYAHGSSLKLTLEKVLGRPDVSSKAKFIAMILSAHWPHVRPPVERLMLLTGFGKSTVARGLAELNAVGLLTWRSGKSRVANEYVCQWLPRPPKRSS